MLAITYKKITKIKVAEWGTPKKYLKKIIFLLRRRPRFNLEFFSADLAKMEKNIFREKSIKISLISFKKLFSMRVSV
jgi:hypothetical protein